MKKGLLIFLLAISSQVLAKESIQTKLQKFTATPLAANKFMNLKQLKGHVVLIDFWASWCSSCKEAIPFYNQLYKKFAEKKFLFLGVNEDDESAPRESFLKQTPIQFPIYHDANQKMSQGLGITALPHLLILDKNLNIIASLSGFKKENEAQIEEKILALLK